MDSTSREPDAARTADAGADAERVPVPEEPPASAEDSDLDLGTRKRGVETMFRSLYRVHMDLSSLADTKANIMISINGIIISIIVAAISPKMDTNPWLLIPTLILLIGSLISIVYAILAARPRVSEKDHPARGLRNRKASVLFFGQYSSMTEDQFVADMTDIMMDKNALYVSMIRDIYGIGRVLSRKFALLRTSYAVFMVGLVLGIATFIGVFLWIVVGSGPAA